MKFSKKQLDLLWPTLSEDYKTQIYALALKGLAALTAEVGYTLTEKHEGLAAERVKGKGKAKGKGKVRRVRHRDIKIHDRVFKDPGAIALFYKCTRSRVSQIVREYGVENIEEHFAKVPATMLRKKESTLVGGA